MTDREIIVRPEGALFDEWDAEQDDFYMQVGDDDRIDSFMNDCGSHGDDRCDYAGGEHCGFGCPFSEAWGRQVAGDDRRRKIVKAVARAAIIAGAFVLLWRFFDWLGEIEAGGWFR